jgi:hypothetical protein
VREKDADPVTAAVPSAAFAEYYRCYADGLADRASISDLNADDPVDLDPIIDAEGRRCFEAMRKSLRSPSNRNTTENSSSSQWGGRCFSDPAVATPSLVIPNDRAPGAVDPHDRIKAFLSLLGRVSVVELSAFDIESLAK